MFPNKPIVIGKLVKADLLIREVSEQEFQLEFGASASLLVNFMVTDDFNNNQEQVRHFW